MGAFDVFDDLAGGFSNGMSKLPFVGGMFESEAEKQAAERFGAIADRYRQLKPEVAQGYSNALNQQLGAFAPSNAMLGAMGGGDPSMMIDMQALGQNPATPGMLNSPQTSIPSGGKTGAGNLIEMPFEGPFGPVKALGDILGF